MGLGLSTGGGDFIPYAKFDARAGRWFRKSENGDVDITDGFTAVFDLEQIEVGWMVFASGVAPVYVTSPASSGLPAKPAGDNWKQGFKVNLALGSAHGGGVYEFSSTAKSVINAINPLYSEYEVAAERASGKLPVIKMTGTTTVETKGPQGVTRNYAPNLSIVGWVDRPASLPKRGAAAPAPQSIAAPPATGSTVVPPPAKAAAPAVASMDFG